MGANGMVIPKLIHRVWVGPDPMPEAFQRYGESWREHHPDWEMRLWTDDNLPPLSRPQALTRARYPTELANLLRYELLAGAGGVYIDTDLECLRPIDPLLEGVEAFTAYLRPGRVGCGILGAVPGHPLFARAVEEAEKRAGEGKSSVRATGPWFMTELVKDFPDVTIFEPAKFYPYDWDEKPRPASEFPDAYAIHHWRRTGRNEPSDPAEKIEFLRDRLAVARRQKARYRRKQAKAQREKGKVRKRAKQAEARATRAEARAQRIESSLWWRMNPRHLVGRLRRALPRAEGKDLKRGEGA